MEEVKLSPRDEYLATFNAINESDKERKIKEYAQDQSNIVALEKYIEEGKNVSGNKIKGLYMHYLSFCCHEKDLEIIQDQFDNIPDDMDSKEILKKVKELVGPAIERREINYDLYHSDELGDAIAQIAAQRKITSEEMIKRLMLKADRQADREFRMVGVDLKSLRDTMKEGRNSSIVEKKSKSSMKKMVLESLLDEKGTNLTDLIDLEGESNRRKEKSRGKDSEYGKD